MAAGVGEGGDGGDGERSGKVVGVSPLTSCVGHELGTGPYSCT